jgi:hypothetical protein
LADRFVNVWNADNIGEDHHVHGKVQSAQPCAGISAYGTVSGAGTFAEGSSVTVTATPNGSRSFVKLSFKMVSGTLVGNVPWVDVAKGTPLKKVVSTPNRVGQPPAYNATRICEG